MHTYDTYIHTYSLLHTYVSMYLCTNQRPELISVPERGEWEEHLDNVWEDVYMYVTWNGAGYLLGQGPRGTWL